MRLLMSVGAVLALAGCYHQKPVATAPNYCLLTSDIRITQSQYLVLDEHADHVLRYLIEQSETRQKECST